MSAVYSATHVHDVFTSQQIQALVVDGALFRLSNWVRRLRSPTKSRQQAPQHEWARRSRVEQPASQPAQLYSDVFEGDMPPRQLLQLLADTDAKLRAGQSIPVMSSTEERRLTHSSAPSIGKSRKEQQRKKTSTAALPRRSGDAHQTSSTRRRQVAQRATASPGRRTSPNAAALVDGRLHRPLVPQAASSLTAQGARQNLQALHEAAQRHSALGASPRRAVSLRTRSNTPSSPQPSARSGEVPHSSPLARHAGAGAAFELPPVPDLSAPPAQPGAGQGGGQGECEEDTPPMPTKKQLRRRRRAEKARQREEHIAAMAAPVPHKVSAKAPSRRQRLQQELQALHAVIRDARAGLSVTVPDQSLRTALDSHAIQLNVSSKADNELVTAVSRARAEAVHAVEMQRLGMPQGEAVQGQRQGASHSGALKPQAAPSGSGQRLPKVQLSSSPYAQGLVQRTGKAGWTTSGQSRPLTSPLKQRNQLYDGFMQRPVSSARGFEGDESDGMASA